MMRTWNPVRGWYLAAAMALALLALPGKAFAQAHKQQPRDTAHAAAQRRDTTQARQPAPDPGRGASAARDTSARGREPITLPTVTLVVGPPQPSLWRPYAFRGVIYAGAAGLGLFLATRKDSKTSEVCTGSPPAQDCFERTVITHPSTGIGLALAAGAAVAGIGDALLTSHRAQVRAHRARTGLLLPAIEPDGDGARLSLVRWSF